MKNVLLAMTFAAISGYAYAQAPAQEPAKAAAQEPAKTADAAVIKVEKMITASSVENKEPVNETTSFDSAVGRVYTWAKVSTTQSPVKIKHVYYADDKKIVEIELDVAAENYRVWSYKSVWPGNWKVETTDENGTVLATVNFTVAGEADKAPKAGTQAPKTEAQAPKAEPPTQGK